MIGQRTLARIVVPLAIAAAALLGGVVVWLARAGEPPPAVTTTTRPTAAILVAVRDLSRLEAAEMHMERVIQMTDTQRVVFGLGEAEDSILLVAAADVVAGVDLSEVGEDDVVLAPDGAVTITVPRATVLSARLDSARTFVHARDTDLLAERSEDLESRARAEAERTLEAAAIEAGLLERAERSAARTLESLLHAVGHERVEVRFR